MADSKEIYSNNSDNYIKNIVPNSDIDEMRFNNSKAREAKWNENWKQQSVNLNDIVNQFVPDNITYREGMKFVYESTEYKVKADMTSGYLRIWDKKLKKYVKLDGTPSKKNSETHFKIKRRSEM